MQSILIIGTIEKTKEKALEIIRTNKVSKFDVNFIETQKAVGIGDIRLLQKQIFLKPIKSEQKAIILESFFGATPEAQNAFLKILEEPPNNTIIIMLVNSLDFILPTVLSRCSVINLHETQKLNKDETEENLNILLLLQKNKNTLKFAQDNGKTREEALKFLEDLIITAHENLSKDTSFGKLIKKFQSTYTIIKTTNISPRFALENLFLSLE